MSDDAERLAQTILRQGELRLNAQLQTALAADQRSMTAAAILIAVSSASIGFGVDAFTRAVPVESLGAGGLLTGVLLAVSSVFCVVSGAPTGFYLTGAIPENWWSDDVHHRSLAQAIRNESNNYSENIKENKKTLKRNAGWFRAGLLMGVGAPFAGAALWALWQATCQTS